MASQFSEHINADLTDGVASIVLDRPEKLNALTRNMLCGLIEAIRWAGVDPRVRCVLLSGRGRMFCAGDDLEGLGPLYDVDVSADTEVIEGPAQLIRRLLTLRKPVVAAVQGGAYVAGLDIILACDYRVAAETTKLGPTCLRLGTPGGLSLLPHYLPLAIARKLLLRAKPLAASEALQLGLVDEIVSGEDLMKRAMEVASEFANGPTLAYGAAKSALLNMVGMSTLQALHMEQDYILSTKDSHDQSEALQAWKEGRPAKFKGC
ncbi:enoyl-CoA hydratase/isomerase family protein [Mesorhizobium abyssinicae]|uniref:enoyl-CoA hydratase/isomerase family protein n=1 Tax=Mesorhizobium abyssinicae TaxID=1209958 RepID=UPI00339AC040